MDKKHPHFFYMLKKSLYGLKHASKAWHKKIDFYFQQHGFKEMQIRSNLHVSKVQRDILLIIFYVDDFLIVGPKYCVD